ncbi:nucleotidyltransferase domain-containing protein [Haloferula sp. A504]|uniref:type VII toxin-antitoxin system MntA family adenylyltransferase antitoxin n=1 Tax=Haloferula sp. A504 TaxID=3373601 RepID=UPI0031BE46D8|nr:nucleotidyltransferase domain-containing protein [Verrucomicrobiaceae bacterium E54]
MISALQPILEGSPDIDLAILFGSFAEGRSGPSSDLDLAVSCGAAMTPERRQELSDRIAGKTGRSVDIIDLATTGGALLGRVLRHGQTLVDRRAGARGLLYERLLDWQEDLRPAVEDMMSQRRQRHFPLSHG